MLKVKQLSSITIINTAAKLAVMHFPIGQELV